MDTVDNRGLTPRNAPCPCGSGKRFKDCHGKRGFGERSYVRVAVRDERDNEYLLWCLTELDRESTRG